MPEEDLLPLPHLLLEVGGRRGQAQVDALAVPGEGEAGERAHDGALLREDGQERPRREPALVFRPQRVGHRGDARPREEDAAAGSDHLDLAREAPGEGERGGRVPGGRPARRERRLELAPRRLHALPGLVGHARPEPAHRADALQQREHLEEAHHGQGQHDPEPDRRARRLSHRRAPGAPPRGTPRARGTGRGARRPRGPSRSPRRPGTSRGAASTASRRGA